jgi:ABC-2 type transport system permease protein
MTATTADSRPLPTRPPGAAARAAFIALLARDLTVLRKRPAEFLARTVVQPLLIVFVLGYVIPEMGRGAEGAGGAGEVATTLLAGMLAMVVLFQGIFAVALPLVQDFGYTREIDDRVLAPLPAGLVAVEKVVVGAVQGLLAAVVVFPLAMFVPATRPDLDVNWLVLVTVAPLAALMCASLGLFFGTAVDPRGVAAVFTILLTPLLWLGCTFFPWSALDTVRWVQVLALADPLTYVSEGFRAAVTPGPHLSLLVIYPVLMAFTGLLLWQGMRHFLRRVIS